MVMASVLVIIVIIIIIVFMVSVFTTDCWITFERQYFVVFVFVFAFQIHSFTCLVITYGQCDVNTI